MDRYYKARTPRAGERDGRDDMSRTSSVYSTDSLANPTYLDSRSASASHSRSSTAYTPSFMSSTAMKSADTLTSNATSHHLPKPSDASTVAQNGNHAAAVEHTPLDLAQTAGILLVITNGTLQPTSILSYLEMLLTRQNFSALALLAKPSEEAALKQVKMKVFALLGRLSKEVTVSVHTQDEMDRSVLENTIADLTKGGAELQGVLCYPAWISTAGILDLEEDHLSTSWKQTVGFAHATIRATLQLLLARCRTKQGTNNGPSRKALYGPKGPFFLVSGEVANGAGHAVAKSACDALLRELDLATRQQGLTIGYAEAVVLPEPKREVPKLKEDLSLQAPQLITHGPQDDPEAGESPTRLYAMWSMQNEIGSYDV